jgi:methionyl-tRNA synthetase
MASILERLKIAFRPEPGQNDMDTPTPTPTNPTIQYDDFAKIELRVATVLDCKAHANADKLLVLQVDLGTEKRQICAGLRQHYQPEQLIGKQIIVVANLASRTMRGEISQGMLLAATDPTTGKVIFVSPSEHAAPGSKVS